MVVSAGHEGKFKVWTFSKGEDENGKVFLNANLAVTPLSAQKTSNNGSREISQ